MMVWKTAWYYNGGLNNRPFGDWTALDHLNTVLVSYLVPTVIGSYFLNQEKGSNNEQTWMDVLGTQIFKRNSFLLTLSFHICCQIELPLIWEYAFFSTLNKKST